MSVGKTTRSGIYTPGSLYKRHQGIGYTPGSHYKRFGNLGLHQPRNMSAMNRQAVESMNAAFQNAGPRIFEARAVESQGLSELAAHQVMARVKAAAEALAQKGESISSASSEAGGDGGEALDEESTDSVDVTV